MASRPATMRQATADAERGVAPAAEPPALTLWESISFSITHAVTSAVLAVCSLRGLYAFGQVFGTLEWLINYRRRRRFHAVLARVLGRSPGRAERRRRTREFFARSRCDKLLYLVFDRVPREVAQGLLTIENQRLLDEALARGHGAHLAMSHHGSPHIFALLMATRGYKTAAVRDQREGALRRFVQARLDKRRPELGRTRWLFADGYPREIYRCLQNGYLVGSGMDVSRVRRPQQRVEDVTIFGERRRFLSGPIRIAMRCHAPVLQAFVMPLPGFRYRLDVVEMLVDPDRITDERDEIARAMRAYAAHVERAVRATPSLITRV